MYLYVQETKAIYQDFHQCLIIVDYLIYVLSLLPKIVRVRKLSKPLYFCILNNLVEENAEPIAFLVRSFCCTITEQSIRSLL